MSDIPPFRPDPTRDVTGEASAEADPRVDPVHPEHASDGTSRTDPTHPTDPTDPTDLPAGTPSGTSGTAYDTTFGLEPAPATSWVPQRSGDAPAPPPVGDPPPAPLVPVRPRTVTLPGTATRLLGGRVQAWHVVAVVIGLAIPLGFWAAANLVDDLDPYPRPAVGITRNRPAVTRTLPVVTSPGIVPSTRPTGGAGTSAAPTAPAPTRSVRTSPPRTVTVPSVPVTPVPANAKTIRFEAYGEGGSRIEVSLSDATHQRYDYPAQGSPLAFEAPVDSKATSNDYFSLRVRTSDPTGSGVRSAVACRVLVDGIVVTAQQGQGYATCYISPYFDILRR